MESKRVVSTLGFRIRAAHQRIQKEFAANFQETGLTPLTFSVFMLVADNPGCRQVELAEVMRVQQTNMVAWLDALVQKGLVSRTPDPADGRVNLISITPAGEAVRPDLEARAARFRGAIATRLGGPEHLRALSETLQILCEWE